MSLTLQFGNDTLGAVENLKVERSGETPETVELWQVTLSVEAGTIQQLEQQLQPARDNQGGTADLKLLQGGSVVRSIAASDCRHGPMLFSLKEHGDQPADAHALRRLTLEFRATLQDAGNAVQAHRFDMVALRQAGHPDRLLTRGKAVLRAGEDPGDHEAVLLPAVTGGFRRVRERVTRDAGEPSLEYEVEDEQVFSALPGGVDDGHYVVTEARGEHGTVRITSGFFVGASANARALELRPPDERTVASRVSQNPYTRRVEFEFRELLDGVDALALTESLTFVTTRRVIDHPLLDTALPAYRQQVGVPQTEVIQEGSAVGHGRHASPPAPRFGADVIERHVHYSLPHPALPANERWVTTWRYVSRSRGRMADNAPEI